MAQGHQRARLGFALRGVVDQHRRCFFPGNEIGGELHSAAPGREPLELHRGHRGDARQVLHGGMRASRLFPLCDGAAVHADERGELLLRQAGMTPGLAEPVGGDLHCRQPRSHAADLSSITVQALSSRGLRRMPASSTDRRRAAPGVVAAAPLA
jgi:hypothetical protein